MTDRGSQGACPFGGAAASGILGPLPGFRHVFGPPAAAERFQVDGQDPRTSPAALATLRRRLRGLATLMGTRPPGAPENPNLPSGYTYLAQFAAHDMVSTSMAFWSAGGPDPGVANALGAPLRLRTLYGGGPGACPFAFAPDDARDQNRSRFRLSAFAGAGGDAACFRDIARAATPGTLGNRGGFSGTGRGEALIADSRNDQSLLLSQLSTLFMLLHNVLLDMLPKPGTQAARSLRERTAARFAVAREATTLVFRNVLRHDLLPRLLDPKVRALYDNPAPEWLEPEPGPGLPLEFSHGAFRFGHAMLRDTYRIGRFTDATLADLLRQNSTRGPNAVPLTRDWLVRWSQFFQLPGRPAPNLSIKLGPRYTPMLMGDGFFDPIEPGDPAGVAFRDLMSASLTGMRSVGSLWAHVAALRPGLAAQSPLLADPAARQAALAEWLGRDSAVSLLTAEDVAALAAEPPLPFYILFEAEHEAEGERLGTLGSLLVAETVYGALARERLASEGEDGLGSALDRLCAAWLGDTRFPDPPLVEDMPGLVGYLARRLGLEAADPAFI
ncbi:peroxidase family protein [Belnapia moabensis]|uniref:peroxidase family protein n=1 Tax=Belnapia moabensis TaxID=365533 RepID=UPI0005BAF72A|nr:peroxidase family protein [Belnapia moabensis]